MDFYHVLPSNSSLDHFPNNKSSQFSTPLDIPYELPGEWEMALMSLTYSSCVNTFNNDTIIFNQNCPTVAQCLEKELSALKVMLPLTDCGPSRTARARYLYAEMINKKFDTLLQVRFNNDQSKATWKVLNKNFYFVLSRGLRNLFQLWSDTLTDKDGTYTTMTMFKSGAVINKPDDSWIMAVSNKPSQHESFLNFTVHEAGEPITAEKLLENFDKVTPNIFKMKLTHKKTKFTMRKLHDDNNLIILNSPLRKSLTFVRAGMFHSGWQRYLRSSLKNVTDKWIVTIIHLKNIQIYKDINRNEVVTLPPCSFSEEKEAVAFLNKKVNNFPISFTLNSDKRVSMKISDTASTITMDGALRDILAFEKTTFSGKQTVTGTEPMSLIRCIQYLYVYSNICSNVRIGNTEAPLLNIIPFTNDRNCKLLKEKIFKTPMYIHVKQKHISQFDIAIYDGAGDLVPFVNDVVTTLFLHFRPV